MKLVEAFATLRKDAAFWSAQIFGTLTAAASIISLVQQAFDVALVPTFARGLLAYRYIAHTVAEWILAPFVYLIEKASDWLNHPISVSLPDWWLDLTVISTITAGAIVRAMLIMRNVKHINFTQFLVLFCITIFIGVSMWGLVSLVTLPLHIAVLQLFKPTNRAEYEAALHNRFYSASVGAIILASAGFFLINHYTL
jgi:hypothetical protein